MNNYKTNRKPNKKFFLGIFLSFVLPVIFVGLFNYIINPYQLTNRKLFGDIYKKHFLEESIIKKTFKDNSKGDKAKISIIGTSHVLHGISICNKPDYEKFALSRLMMEEAITFIQLIIQNSNVSKTILVELSNDKNYYLLENIYHSRLHKFDFHERFLHARTLRASLIHFKIILKPSDYLSDECNSTLEDTPLPNLHDLEKLNNKFTIQLNSSLKFLKTLTSSLTNDKEYLNHKIVFFSPPLPYSIVDTFNLAPLIKARNNELQNIISEINQKSPNIKYSFEDLLNSELGSEYIPWTPSFNKGWYDTDHFKPVIGEHVLRRLLPEEK
ncbi:hypothetical protein [uncultured Arcticibacterium sp.]|uniref:hypothetical protein n=1 Tax=uncultured Arcticibacterium sp. TaxID=2173042 RepID=UPI0030FC7D88